MFAKPILASSATTRSAVTSVFQDRARIAALRATWILAILNSCEACTSAVFALYPARIAACFPLRSMRYSATKRDCLEVSMTDKVGLSRLKEICSNLKRLSRSAGFAFHVVDSRFRDSVVRLQVLGCRYSSGKLPIKKGWARR